MPSEDWSPEENDLIVADYFAMLGEDVHTRPHSTAEHRRALRPLLNGRSDGSIEFKHQNISAVLKGLGEAWIPGYKPAFNFQMSLVDAVVRWLERNPAWFTRLPDLRLAPGLRETASIFINPPPTFSNQPPPKELEQMLRIARKYDVAERDERKRGRAKVNRRWRSNPCSHANRGARRSPRSTIRAWRRRWRKARGFGANASGSSTSIAPSATSIAPVCAWVPPPSRKHIRRDIPSITWSGKRSARSSAACAIA
jgi:hypothetical protein